MTKEELRRVCERLEAAYRDRFIDAGASAFNAWANGARVGVEAAYGKGSGPIWAVDVRYARRLGWFGLFGPLVPFKTLDDLERELGEQIEWWLASGLRPRVFGNPPGPPPRPPRDIQ
ncbi:MAG TPA: hypothetical protein VF494_11140 [Candidatus Limnocylindrales bacterium]